MTIYLLGINFGVIAIACGVYLLLSFIINYTNGTNKKIQFKWLPLKVLLIPRFMKDNTEDQILIKLNQVLLFSTLSAICFISHGVST